MHLVPLNLLALHGLEGSGTHVQRQFLQVHSLRTQGVEHTGREMQAGGGCGHGPLYLGVNGLVGRLVALLRFAVQVGRDGQLTKHFEDVGKGHFGIVPMEIHPMAGTAAFAPLGDQCQRTSLHRHLAAQGTFLPLLQVAYHAEPGGMAGLLEIQRIVVRLNGFKAEHLDERARLLAEVQAGLDDLGIVEYHQTACRQIIGQGGEAVFSHLAMPVNQQLGLVAYGQGKLGDAFVGQRIVELADVDMSGILFHNHRFLSDAKVRIIGENAAGTSPKFSSLPRLPSPFSVHNRRYARRHPVC